MGARQVAIAGAVSSAGRSPARHPDCDDKDGGYRTDNIGRTRIGTREPERALHAGGLRESWSTLSSASRS